MADSLGAIQLTRIALTLATTTPQHRLSAFRRRPMQVNAAAARRCARKYAKDQALVRLLAVSSTALTMLV